MDINTNKGQNKVNLLNIKSLESFSDSQKLVFNKCLELLKGTSFYEAERILFALLDAIKQQSIIT